MNTLIPVLRRNRQLRHPESGLFDQLFENFNFPEIFSEGKEMIPKIDVSETEKDLLLRAEVPGVKKDDIEVTLTDGLLTIKGEKKHESEEKKENFHRVESYYGSFSRTLRLPGEIEANNVEANYKDGVLKITIPKAKKAETKKINIGE